MSKQTIKIFIMTIIVMAFFGLIGTSYAYYQTRIIENPNDKTVKLQTKTLKVEYEDGTSSFSGTTNYFIPGNEFSKTFTVKNTGDDTAQYNIILRDVKNNFSRTEDLEYSLKVGNEEIAYGTFPTETKKIILHDRKLAYNANETYTLTVTYLSTTESQNEDIGKYIEAVVDIEGTTSYLAIAEEGTLLHAINRDNNVTDPKTIPAEEVSANDEAVLATTLDDDATSYYFRGNIKNNYVNFAGMCWRIVRVQGNGGIKLILEDQNTTCNNSNFTGNWNIGDSNYGYRTSTMCDETGCYSINVADYLNPKAESENSLITKFQFFEDNNLNNYDDKLMEFNICTNDVGYISESDEPINKASYQQNKLFFYYDAYKRLYLKQPLNPTLKCSGTETETKKVATITADEVVFAGGKTFADNSSFYLVHNTDATFWTLTLSSFSSNGNDYAFNVETTGTIDKMQDDSNIVTKNHGARPVIVLKRDVTITTNSDTQNYGLPGTQNNPYVIDEN